MILATIFGFHVCSLYLVLLEVRFETSETDTIWLYLCIMLCVKGDCSPVKGRTPFPFLEAWLEWYGRLQTQSLTPLDWLHLRGLRQLCRNMYQIRKNVFSLYQMISHDKNLFESYQIRINVVSVYWICVHVRHLYHPCLVHSKTNRDKETYNRGIKRKCSNININNELNSL